MFPIFFPLFFTKIPSRTRLTHTYTHAHTTLRSVLAAPNVWASRHTAGLPPSLPAASSWPLDTSSSTWPTQLVQSLHNVDRSLAYTHTHTSKHTHRGKHAWADTTCMLVYQTDVQKCTQKYQEIKVKDSGMHQPSQHTQHSVTCNFLSHPHTHRWTLV